MACNPAWCRRVVEPVFATMWRRFVKQAGQITRLGYRNEVFAGAPPGRRHLVIGGDSTDIEQSTSAGLRVVGAPL